MQWWAAFRRSRFDEASRSGVEVVPCGGSIDKSDFACLNRRQQTPTEHEIEGERGAEQLHGSDRSAEAGLNSKLNLGKPKTPLVALHGNAIVAGECEL